MQRINSFLDRFVLPWPVKFLTHRFIILLTISLMIPLIVYASEVRFVLTVNSYLNTMSVAVSSIVLLYATIAEIRDRQVATMQEQRAQEDHAHVVQMHQLLLEGQQTNFAQIQELKQMLAELKGIPFQAATHPVPLGTDLGDLHPRGRKRLEKGYLEGELARPIPHQLGDAIARTLHGRHAE